MSSRTAARRLGFTVAVGGGVCALAVWIFDGFSVSLFGATLRSHELVRPLVTAAAGYAVFLGARDRVAEPVSAGVANGRAHDAAAIALALAAILIGVVFGTTSAGGSDSFGYVSQAELWMTGTPTVDQPWARSAPWPLANWTFTPVGYAPSGDPQQPWTMVPTYPPGLPWLMALAKLIGGQEALFWIPPLFGGLLVLGTYAIARHLTSATVGVAAAWLVLTSPVMLYMLVSPMSDVPAAGAWAVAFCFLFGSGRRSALAAGLAAAVAVTIRPHLVFGAGIMAAYYAVSWWRATPAERPGRLRQAMVFAVGALPGIAAIAAANHALYGSPLRSGYGDVTGLFSRQFFWPNLRSYSTWLIETQTPIVLPGIAALMVPARRVWPTPNRAAILTVATFTMAVCLFHSVYLHLESWSTLRLLLPAWPFISIGTAAVVYAAVPRRATVVAVVVIAIIGGFGLRVARQRGVFVLWTQDRSYPAVARRVQQLTDEQSVIIALQHSGSVRYYAGRVTLRYDFLPPEWLDRAVEWLDSRGVRPYLLVTNWEVPTVQERFSGQRTLGRLEREPVLRYGSSPEVLLYDLSPRDDRGTDRGPFREPQDAPRSASPVPLAVPSALGIP